jgi:hypothetical protein
MRMPVIALLLVVSQGCAAAATRYVDLVNTAPDSIASFAVAAAGSDDFRAAELGGTPLQGGGDSTTIALAEGGCLRDFRTVFADGHVLVQKNFDVCKYRSYHTGQYLRRAAMQPTDTSRLVDGK